jgi:hypothetical protein
MRLGLATVLYLLATVSVTADDKADCTCKYEGGDVKQGETACIKTVKGKSLARCEMVLNNTSWTVLDQPCDVQQSLEKKPSAAPILDPHGLMPTMRRSAFVTSAFAANGSM